MTSIVSAEWAYSDKQATSVSEKTFQSRYRKIGQRAKKACAACSKDTP